MRKLLTALIAGLTTCSLLAGCTNPGSQNTNETPTELSGEITFWHSFTQGPRLETIQQAADSFTAKHPDVSIKIETFSWSDFYTKWTTGLASGNVPDLSTALPSHVVEMIESEAIIPLDDLIDSVGRDRFQEAPLKEMTLDEATYAVPLYSHAQVMWYRKDLLAKYDLTVPTTWEEFAAAANTITAGEKGEAYGVSVPMGTNDMMATRFLNFYTRSAGSSLLTSDHKPNLTSPEAIEGTTYWTDLYRSASPKDSLNYNVLDQATLFYQGKTAFDFNSGFHISGVKENRPDLLEQIDAAPIPSVSGTPKAGYETSNIPLVVWKNSKHPEIAKAFIEHLYQDEQYIPFLLSVPVGMLPALKDVAENKTYLADPTVQEFQEELKVISEAVGVGSAIGMESGPNPEAGLLTSQHVVEEMFQDIIVNSTAVPAAAESANSKLAKLFESLG
ncbi:MAG: sugar ABC transporter substrate-binding protein [Propionibacteriaceae bacterium]|nr:sugar ABC transporter substrate-binding protein [Propionibacteriaceae bacterium]